MIQDNYPGDKNDHKSLLEKMWWRTSVFVVDPPRAAPGLALNPLPLLRRFTGERALPYWLRWAGLAMRMRMMMMRMMAVVRMGMMRMTMETFQTLSNCCSGAIEPALHWLHNSKSARWERWSRVSARMVRIKHLTKSPSSEGLVKQIYVFNS